MTPDNLNLWDICCSSLGIDWGFSFQVIFTNESNIERWKNKRQLAVDSKIGRLENFMKRVQVPIQVIVEPKQCGSFCFPMS